MTLTYTLKLVRNVARVASIRNSGNLGSETSDRSVGGGGRGETSSLSINGLAANLAAKD